MNSQTNAHHDQAEVNALVDCYHSAISIGLRSHAMDIMMTLYDMVIVDGGKSGTWMQAVINRRRP